MINIEKLNKSFGDKVLFNNFSYTINDGEFVIFSGKSGCGKTTLLNMIGGIEPFENGKIIVDGMDISKRRNLINYLKNKVGFLFQNFALIENKTVEQNLKLVRKSAKDCLSINDALEKVGLKNELKTKIYKLSGGEQQRVALARLMVKKCDIILADEPTGSLDKENADKVMEILQQLNNEGKTVLLVTHSSEYNSVCTKLLKL